MAKFEGTIKDFIKFIGAYSTNKVNYITKKYRKEIGKCQDCGDNKSVLESAHFKDNSRLDIITDILMGCIDENKIVRINLQEYEDRFLAAHNPIKNTIRILCKDCHVKYDHGIKKIEQDINNDKVDIDLEVVEKQEAEFIEELIRNSKMNKGIALQLADKYFPNEINFSNSVYSNQNNVKDVWWLEPSFDKFNHDFFMLLNKPKENKLLIFKIPNGTIDNPKVIFNQRNDKNASKIIIPISDSAYVDSTGYDFTSYLVKEKVY